VCHYCVMCSFHSYPPISFFFYCYREHRRLHSFPTRRSSDLVVLLDYRERAFVKRFGLAALSLPHVNRGEVVERVADQKVFAAERSEEHTSELQSPYELVCRLLLEKKKY